MIRLTITERGGAPKSYTFPKDDITIGRAQNNDIILPRNNISKKHTRVFRSKGALLVRDMDSTNGTFLNGRRIRGDETLQPGDRIFLADFVLIIEGDESAQTPAPPEARKTAGPPPLPDEGGLDFPSTASAEVDEVSALPLDPSDLEPASTGPFGAGAAQARARTKPFAAPVVDRELEPEPEPEPEKPTPPPPVDFGEIAAVDVA
ncbi:MAG: FHA domain-containing protein, partial [Myxococcota bacterium]|nr:FHA domain-containing protein [Myxococcota bacterium]